ncbi:MAG: AAA family ATPase, partial [Clostridia bacterium]|nr:AAA family ATPase [Clostridia bacterium]
MRIRSLELQGFKSFPDKTVVNFDSGVTIIVGPNGSGKSNISDAIRWVLGEISSKNIRGSKMEDVIFGGTDTRRQMGFAEVSITIDNTDRSNRMNIDYDIVTVTRRYYRTGESEYFINAKPVRLKDIAELFMNTGIGRTGYSVIGQGKISEIVSKKSEDRRNIFEEAAGISKYRYKKKEAERKLEETNVNLVRVTDILAELESRVHPLEKEAAKARTYLDMYDEKKQADVSLWLYDIAAIRTEYENVNGAYTIASKELEIIDDEIKALETQNDALYIETQNAKAEREGIESKIKALTERYHELESSGKVLENDITHLTALIGRCEADKAAAEAKLASLADERTANTEALNARKTALAELTELLKAFTSKLEDIRKAIYEAGEAKDEQDAKLLEHNNGIIEMRAKLSSLSQTDTTADIEGILALDKECVEHIELLAGRIEKAQKAISEYDARIQETLAEVTGKWEDTLKSLESEITALSTKRDKLTLKISTADQRLETLRRMAEHFEGFAHSVKFVMECASDGTLKGVHGTVSDIIDTDPEYAVAIETALGNNIQNIVVDNETTTKRAIALLKENRA